MNATVLDQPLTIEPADLARKIQEGENLVLIDVRTTGEFRSGHIPRSINIPMDEIEARLDDVPEGGQVVLVCHSGNRAAMTREILSGAIPDAVCLAGGVTNWADTNHEVIRSTRTRLSLPSQAMIGASAIILLSVALGTFVSPNWFYLALLPGFGLLTAGTTGFCLMGTILGTMPWNKTRAKA